MSTRAKARIASLCALAGAACVPALARAAAPPPPASPGAINSGLIQRGESLQAPGANANAPATMQGEAPTQPTASSKAARLAFTLQRVDFPPSRFLSAAELQRLAQPLIGRRVSIDDLRGLVKAVNDLYARRRILTARAFLPPQKVHDGVVRIELLEGRLGRLKVEAKGYTSARYVEKNLHITGGEVVDLGQLRTAITDFNHDNDAQLSASLQAGARAGLTDIDIAVTEPARNAIQLFGDTYGYESTGRYEGGAFFRHSGLLTSGDRATLYVVGAVGSITGNAAYNLPLFGDQGRLGVSYARSAIEITSGVGQKVQTHGYSDTAAVNYGRPLAGGEGWGLALLSSVSWARSENQVAGVSVDTSAVTKGTFGASYFADLWGRAHLTSDATVSGASVEHIVGGVGPAAFFETNADFDLRASPFAHATLRLAGSGQYVDANATPGSQLFQIGGPTSVRGYATGIATGVSGYYLNAELHYVLSPFHAPVDVYGFFDGGQVFAPGAVHTTLRGTGVGVEVPVRRFADVQVFYAHGFDASGVARAADRLEGRLVLSF